MAALPCVAGKLRINRVSLGRCYSVRAVSSPARVYDKMVFSGSDKMMLVLGNGSTRASLEWSGLGWQNVPKRAWLERCGGPAKAQPGGPARQRERLQYGKGLALVSALLVSMLCSAGAKAAGITIDGLAVDYVNGAYYVNADVDYQLSEPALQALRKGVDLTIKVTIAVMRPRGLLWDRAVATEHRFYQLSYHALTDQYSVSYNDGALQQSFPTLSSAVSELGRLRHVPVPLFDRAVREQREYVRLRAVLDIESLPVPLRLLAYVQPAWHHNSGWQRWTPPQ